LPPIPGSQSSFAATVDSLFSARIEDYTIGGGRARGDLVLQSPANKKPAVIN
jgi:hypothetical protein